MGETEAAFFHGFVTLFCFCALVQMKGSGSSGSGSNSSSNKASSPDDEQVVDPFTLASVCVGSFVHACLSKFGTLLRLEEVGWRKRDLSFLLYCVANALVLMVSLC